MRKKSSHKGDNGIVLVVAGSEQYVGAAVLTSLAAFRTGVDLVHLASAEVVSLIANAYSPDLITHKLPGKYLKRSHCKKIVELSKKADVVVIGPGLGRNKDTVNAVRYLTKNIKKPIVLDADALHARPALKNCVVTPHRAEFKELFREDATKAAVKRHAKKDVIILLKSQTDIISDGKKVKLNKTGNAGMTVGGTGDVLAGIVAGLIAQGTPLFNAAVKGAFINGRAGDRLKKRKGFGFLASDILEQIPLVMKR
jgi:NAD(P)H-hydrate epimerase